MANNNNYYFKDGYIYNENNYHYIIIKCLTYIYIKE